MTTSNAHKKLKWHEKEVNRALSLSHQKMQNMQKSQSANKRAAERICCS